jgi:hypothetical protein
MRSSLYLALGGLALAAQAAGAQDACENLKPFFAEPPQLGEWADLRMDLKDEKPAVSRISFVGKEQRGGQDVYRMQMVTNMNGKQHIMQVLTPWDMSVMSQDLDSEIVMKMGDQPATSMSVAGGEDKTGVYDLRKECAKIKFVGVETVDVPAGSFKTHHYSGPDGDMWLAKGVPAMRMVRMVTTDGDSIVLTAVGTGAKNEITEKPMDMNAILADPEAMKRMMQGDKLEDKK